MWPAQQEKASEDRGWNSCHCRIPPVGRCHILAQRDQGEGFPLRGQSDLILLGPHSCPLLPWRVGSEVTHCNSSRCWGTGHWSDLWLLFQFSHQEPPLLCCPGEKCSEWKRPDYGANVQGGGNHRPRRVRQQWGELQQRHRYEHLKMVQYWCCDVIKALTPLQLSCSPAEAEGQRWEVRRGE